jgi:hypothetical protein
MYVWWGRSKKKGRGVRGWWGKKKGKKKEKRNEKMWYVGGGGKKKKKKKKGRGERGRIYNGNRGRGRRKMGKEGILGVVKKINK